MTPSSPRTKLVFLSVLLTFTCTVILGLARGIYEQKLDVSRFREDSIHKEGIQSEVNRHLTAIDNVLHEIRDCMRSTVRPCP